MQQRELCRIIRTNLRFSQNQVHSWPRKTTVNPATLLVVNKYVNIDLALSCSEILPDTRMASCHITFEQTHHVPCRISLSSIPFVMRTCMTTLCWMWHMGKVLSVFRLKKNMLLRLLSSFCALNHPQKSTLCNLAQPTMCYINVCRLS